MDDRKLYLLLIKSSLYNHYIWDISTEEQYNEIYKSFASSPLPSTYDELMSMDLNHEGIAFFYTPCKDTAIAYFCISHNYNRLDGVRMFHQTTLTCLSGRDRDAWYSFESN